MPVRTARPALAIALSAGLLVAGGTGPGKSGESTPPSSGASDPARAVELYEDGRYAEARAILEAIDAAGQASGALLYRLFFCRKSAGDLAGAKQAIDRATAALEREHRAEPGLESAFYLANTYQNLDRGAEARRVAAEATARLEAKAWPAPSRALEVFQVGKLYEDQGRPEHAARWYQKALERFAAEGRPHPGHARWATRYLAQQAFSRADFAAADKEYSELVALGGASQVEWIRLAVARFRLGRYEAASEAWRQAEKTDPAHGDDARYSWRLAQTAAALGSLPAQSPDGRPWNRLSKEELEEVLLAKANLVREARAKAAEGTSSIDDAARASLEKDLAAAKPLFVAAGLEYAARGLPIRETAFTNEYAPLIFHPEDWELPKAPE